VPQLGLNGRRRLQPRGRSLGGSSLINAMIYMRGQPQDYDGWAHAGCEGWSWRHAGVLSDWVAEASEFSRELAERALAHAPKGPFKGATEAAC